MSTRPSQSCRSWIGSRRPWRSDTTPELWNGDCTDTDTVQATAAREGIDVPCFQANRGGSLIRAEHRERVGPGVRASLVEAKEMGVKALFLLTNELGQDRGVVHWFPASKVERKRRNVLLV